MGTFLNIYTWQSIYVIAAPRWTTENLEGQVRPNEVMLLENLSWDPSRAGMLPISSFSEMTSGGNTQKFK